MNFHISVLSMPVPHVNSNFSFDGSIEVAVLTVPRVNSEFSFDGSIEVGRRLLQKVFLLQV